MTHLLALIHALTAALKAFPLWLVWRVSTETRDLKSRIIEHESRNTPTDRRFADLLRVQLAENERLHDALQSAFHPPESGQ